MARFDVYRHPDVTQRARTPYLIDVQNDYIAGLHTRVVLPVRSDDTLPQPMRDLHPRVEIEGRPAVIDAAALAAVPVAELRQPVANLRHEAAAIGNALDALFGTY